MTARSRTRSSVSTPHPLTPSPRCGEGNSFTRPIAQVAPVQLPPQPLEEALRTEPNQQDGPLGAADFEALAGLNRRAHLAVEGDEHFVAPRRNRLDRHD